MEDEKQKQDPRGKCMNMFDKFMYCGTPRSQFNYIYRHGEPESCGLYFNDWIKCLHAKLIFDAARKEKIFDSMESTKLSDHKNSILELKEIPKWPE